MTEQATQRHPTEINLHSKSRLLSIVFDDGNEIGFVPTSPNAPRTPDLM